MTEKITELQTKLLGDKMNQAILRQLRQNGRMSWQELGKRVHLSGQAVAERVKQLQDAGVITGFGIRERGVRHFITVVMGHTEFGRFEQFLTNFPNIESVDKTSGEGCYFIVYVSDDNGELDEFLMQILAHGSYRLASSVRRVI